MKIILICALISSISLLSKAQESSPLTAEEYFKKSKRQGTAAKVMLISGSTIGLTGFYIAMRNTEGVLFLGDRKKYDAGEALFFSGIGIAAASVPFFILSGKNKKKALKLVPKNEPVVLPVEKGLSKTHIAALSLKLSF